MASSKFNGKAKWIMVAIATGVLAYNTIATHVLARNDILHLTKDVQRIDGRVEKILDYLILEKK